MIRSLLTALKFGTRMLGVTAVGCVLATAGMLQAQTSESPSPSLSPPAPPQPLSPAARSAVGAPVTSTGGTPSVSIFDPMVKPASGCASCGMRGGCNGCGAHDYGRSNLPCVPGRQPCCGFDPSTVCGRLFGGLCEEFCCPDPCYEPRWIAEANAAFFQDSPRPVTQTRIRWDAAFNVRFPDTSEFMQAQANARGPKFTPQSLHYNDLTFYQEIAAKGASTFVELPYRAIEAQGGPDSSGFGDMNLGVKTVLLDREIFLLTMQFKTILPTGLAPFGLGAGHVSLEPSLLAALKLSPTGYLQTQLAEWIPIGGSSGVAGPVFHYHVALNQRLCQWGNCVSVIGTGELNGYLFNGGFTDLTGVLTPIHNSTYLNAGPGVRIMFCNTCDIGFAAAFGFGNDHGPAQLYRTELRIRY